LIFQSLAVGGPVAGARRWGVGLALELRAQNDELGLPFHHQEFAISQHVASRFAIASIEVPRNAKEANDQ